jgi:excisionase family DNA binding protein
VKYLTLTEVAARLRRHRKLVARWVADGRLKAERLGPVWVVNEDALSRFTPPPRKWTTRPKAKRGKR